MPEFAIPGLMPSTYPKWKFKKTANADGSLDLLIYETTDSSELLPIATFYILWQCDTQLAYDEAGASVYVVTNGNARTLVIKIRPGVLPIGICTFHVTLNKHVGSFINAVYTVEVPNSPFHIYAPFDPRDPDQV